MSAQSVPEELIFLDPVCLPKIWGGSRLQELYGRPPSGERIGECIAISGHPDADCRVRGGSFGQTPVSALWRDHRDLFGGVGGDSFPLQVKFIDACEDLSVQVHPDAAYARKHGLDEAKNECWYVLGPDQSKRIVIGHNAASRDELARLVSEGRWDELLSQREMHEGDFFFIPAGTAHCILAGSLIYEVAQSSSTTYRLYDYDRVDVDGRKRDLHIEQALAVLKVPDVPVVTAPSTVVRGDASDTLFIRNEYFSLRKWDVRSATVFPVEEPFLLAGVVEGSGLVNGAHVARGDHFIVPNAVRILEITGPVSLMVTSL